MVQYLCNTWGILAVFILQKKDQIDGLVCGTVCPEERLLVVDFMVIAVARQKMKLDIASLGGIPKNQSIGTIGFRIDALQNKVSAVDLSPSLLLSTILVGQLADGIIAVRPQTSLNETKPTHYPFNAALLQKFFHFVQHPVTMRQSHFRVQKKLVFWKIDFFNTMLFKELTIFVHRPFYLLAGHVALLPK
jgi:hypothetical protein